MNYEGPSSLECPRCGDAYWDLMYTGMDEVDFECKGCELRLGFAFHGSEVLNSIFGRTAVGYPDEQLGLIVEGVRQARIRLRRP